MTAFSISSGRFTPGVLDAVATPRVRHAANPLAVFMPGGGINPSTGFMSGRPMVNALTDAGFCVVQPDVDTGAGLGNAAALSRVSDAVTWGRANLACKPTGLVMVGASQGGMTSAKYARTHADVLAVATCIMPIDIVWLRDNNISGLAASIDTLYGITGSDPLPAHEDILPYASEYAAIGSKFQMWVSSNDVLDNQAAGHTEQGFAMTIGADYHSAGAVGHLETSWSGLDPATVVAFFLART